MYNTVKMTNQTLPLELSGPSPQYFSVDSNGRIHDIHLRFNDTCLSR